MGLQPSSSPRDLRDKNAESEPPPMSRTTFAEAAEMVLADTRRTMTAEEIWFEIERRGLIVSDGKTPAATLYTELMRKSVNWRAKGDDRAPCFYRRGGGAFGRWIDLTPEQQKAMLASTATPSPSDSWRELHDRVKNAPDWKTRIAALTIERARVASEIDERIRTYLSGTSPLEALRAALDQRSRAEWATFTFNGTSFAMLLNMLTKVTTAAPSLDVRLRATMGVPADEAAGRAALQGMSAALETLRLSGDTRKIPHPNRIPKLFSGLWHVQAPAEWPIYYRSARDALAETGVVTPSDDPIDSYLTFRRFFLQLAGELGVTSWSWSSCACSSRRPKRAATAMTTTQRHRRSTTRPTTTPYRRHRRRRHTRSTMRSRECSSRATNSPACSLFLVTSGISCCRGRQASAKRSSPPNWRTSCSEPSTRPASSGCSFISRTRTRTSCVATVRNRPAASSTAMARCSSSASGRDLTDDRT
ncbi:MAG: winged helix-turn-helix domain-containing protein [Deltaproteobacteria bacterium]|nr:winged helix-turn-helix domain-containing protein [Deltaproteobacteria bacterium]